MTKEKDIAQQQLVSKNFHHIVSILSVRLSGTTQWRSGAKPPDIHLQSDADNEYILQAVITLPTQPTSLQNFFWKSQDPPWPR